MSFWLIVVCFYGFQCNSSAFCESLKGFFCDLQTAWRLVLSMKPWSYMWLEFGLFSTIIAIIRACACWALFVVTLTNTVHLIYIYIYTFKQNTRLPLMCHKRQKKTIYLVLAMIICIWTFWVRQLIFKHTNDLYQKIDVHGNAVVIQSLHVIGLLQQRRPEYIFIVRVSENHLSRFF